MISESTPEGVGAGGLLETLCQQSSPRLLYESLALTLPLQLVSPSLRPQKPGTPRHRHHRR